MSDCLPRFLVPPTRLYTGWLGAFEVLLKREATGGMKSVRTIRVPFVLPESEAGWPLRGFFSSTVFHFVFFFVLLRVPFGLLGVQPTDVKPNTKPEEIFYKLELADNSHSLPNLTSPGPGGRPGKGTRPDKLPPKGSDAYHPKLTIVINPPRPDNHHQTIIQPMSPPDLIIPNDVQVPTVLAGNPFTVRKPSIQVHVLGAGEGRSPTVALGAPQVPNLSATPGGLELSPSTITNPMARLTVPLPVSGGAELLAPRSGSGNGEPGQGQAAENGGEASGLLAISSNPGEFRPNFALPPGNRYAAMSISPSGGQPGSPGGVPGGDPQGGVGGPGRGGDASEGVGPGNSGGGGGNSGLRRGVTITGGSREGGTGISSKENPGEASPGSRAGIGSIFPILAPVPSRRVSLLISAGPIGGGGLDVYNILRGGKIYTIFLPMPGKNWILEFCQHAQQDSAAQSNSSSGIVNLEQTLSPPEPTERFDFERGPLPEKDAEKRIILRGVLRVDGTLDGLTVVRGVSTQMDETAVMAFGKWKFKPALRAKISVEVEILVGIPAQVVQP